MLCTLVPKAVVDDVREQVRIMLHAENRITPKDASVPARSRLTLRLNEFALWKNRKRPLDHGVVYEQLSRIISKDAESAAHGLPESARKSCTLDDLVNIMWNAAVAETKRKVRPPIWSQGALWPVLRVVVAEAKVKLIAAGITDKHEDLIKKGLRRAIRNDHISFINDAVAGAGSEPSVYAWTTVGDPEDHRSGRTILSGLSADERLAIQLAQSSKRAAAADVRSPWDAGRLRIVDYHQYMSRESLPDELKLPTGFNDPVTIDGYNWAMKFHEDHPLDWRSQLARNLAFLVAKMLPNVFVPGPEERDAEIVKALEVVDPHDDSLAISIIRQVPWIAKPGSRGVSDFPSTYAIAALLFLSYIHPQSSFLQNPNKNHKAWHNKHSESYPL